MGRRRSTALRDAAGAHHVASRLSHEGFRAAVEHAARFSWSSTAAGLLATYRAALAVRYAADLPVAAAR